MFKFIFLSFFIVSLAFADLKVTSHMAGEAGFLVNSFLITGETEAVLIDAQFLKSEADAVVKMIKDSKKKLTTIVITHGHPDHYFGLDTLTAEFPEAKVIASKPVVEEIKKKGPGYLTYWKTKYPEKEMPKKIVEPLVAFDPKDKEISLKVDNDTLTLKYYGPAESESSLVVLAPSIKSIFAGDLLYNKVYLWLAEERPNDWLKNLKLLEEEKDVETFYPGHGEKGDKKLIGANRKYIEDFVAVIKKSKTRKEAMDEMLKRYPKADKEKKIDGYRLDIILTLSIEPAIKE